MNRRKSSLTTQVTLDDDFNVPDSMDDVEQLILESGEIQIDSVRNLGERAAVKGKLSFRVLYRTPEGQIRTLAGSFPLDEMINIPDLREEDVIQAAWELDDLHMNMINSRKLNGTALITLHIQAETIEDAEIASDVSCDGTVETLKKVQEAALLSARKKDTFRVKENLTLPGNRPDIDKLLWQNVKLRNVSTKPMDGRIHLEGELMVFLIYSGEDGRMPIQCLEETIGFSGDLRMEDSNEERIPMIFVKLLHKDVEVNPDADGEMREISVDAVIELDIRLYQEEEIELLDDLYALDREISVENGTVCFDQILVKNNLKHRIQEKVSLGDGRRILQICHSDGAVKIDEVQVKEDGLHLYGALEAVLLSLTADDADPVATETKLLPFHVIADIPGNKTVRDYQMEAGVEQISAVMLGQDMVEIKAVVTFDILVMGETCEKVVSEIRETPVDVEKLKAMPGIVGYVVQPGDSLWKIAREFHTSVDEIMAANRLTERTIHPGDKLILIKTVKRS